MNQRDDLTRQFREIQPKFSRFYARLLTQANLTLPQFALLSQLAYRGTVSMTEISAKLHITKPAVTNLADRLEKNRFLKRLPHPKDRRVSLLQIQLKGERMVRRTQEQALNLLLKALNPFSTGERKTIARFYVSLSQALDEVLERARERSK